MADLSTPAPNPPASFPNTIAPLAAVATNAGAPVYPSAAGVVALAAATGAAALARPVGIARRFGAADEPIPVCYSGPVELPTAEWDAVTGQTGGLTAGSRYFLGNTAGHLSTSAGDTGVQIGMAVSATLLIVQILRTA